MNKVFFCLSLVMIFLMEACGPVHKNDVVGEWKEYRANGDNYLLSSWKFNSDGSGLFIVQGFTNTQKIALTWRKINSSEIEVTMSGETDILELSNGLLIENSGYNTIVYKKQ